MITGRSSIDADLENLEAQSGRELTPNVLGDNFLAYLTLALGGALFLGTTLAVLRPQPDGEDGELVRAPLGRSLILITIGAIATVWSLATIVA